MKRFIKCFIAIAMSVGLLVGCNSIESFSAPNEKSFVSAIGIDKEGERLKISLEIAGDGRDTAPSVAEGTGESLSSAFLSVFSSSPTELMFTHCRAVVFGDEISRSEIGETVLFCREVLSLPLSTRLISTDNALTLLSFEDESFSNGFAISDIAERTADTVGFGGHTAIYEIETARLLPSPVFALPRFSLSGGKREVVGLTVYNSLNEKIFLDRQSSIAYAVIRGVFEAEEVNYDGKSEQTGRVSSRVDARLQNGRLHITVTVFSKQECELLLRLLADSVGKYKEDVFGIENILAEKKSAVLEAMGDSFPEHYQKAVFSVRRG